MISFITLKIQPEEKLSKPRHTKASKKAAEAAKEKVKEEKNPKQEFKMKRFKNVSPRTDTHNHKISGEKMAELPTEVKKEVPAA